MASGWRQQEPRAWDPRPRALPEIPSQIPRITRPSPPRVGVAQLVLKLQPPPWWWLFLSLEFNRKRNVRDVFCSSHAAILAIFWIKEILPLVCYNILFLSLGFILPFSHLAGMSALQMFCYGVLGAFPTGRPDKGSIYCEALIKVS